MADNPDDRPLMDQVRAVGSPQNQIKSVMDWLGGDRDEKPLRF